MFRSKTAFQLLLVLSFASLATAAHAQVVPSYPGGNVVASAPAPEKTSLSTTLQVRPAGLDLSAVERWFRTSWWSAAPRQAAAPRSQRVSPLRDTHRSL